MLWSDRGGAPALGAQVLSGWGSFWLLSGWECRESRSVQTKVVVVVKLAGAVYSTVTTSRYK